jgi:hypothetical protein
MLYINLINETVNVDHAISTLLFTAVGYGVQKRSMHWEVDAVYRKHPDKLCLQLRIAKNWLDVPVLPSTRHFIE